MSTDYGTYMQDLELLNRLKSREELALKEAIDRYKSMVYKIAIGFTHDREVADDIVQDVFLKLWEKAPDLDLKNTKLSTWLYRVALNHSINYSRREKFKSFVHDLSQFTRTTDDGAVEIQIEDSAARDPQQYAENKELGEILKKAIDSLPKKQRIAFILTKYQGMSAKEVAEVMDLSPGNVDVLVYRAKKAMQKKILKIMNEE